MKTPSLPLNSFIALVGEIRKQLLTAWTYRVNTVVALLTIGFVFVGIAFLMSDGTMTQEEIAPMFVGYLTWFYAMGAIGDLSWGIRSEISAGTLEQISMSPAPIGFILLGRVFANLITSTVQLLIQGTILMLVLNIRLPMRWEAIPALAITLVGVFGFGFVLAGATLIFKQIESLANLFQNMLMFFNGMLLPLSAMPGWLAAIARTMPTTQGVYVLQRLLLDGVSLADAWRDGSLIWLLVNSSIYFAIGWVVFSACERIAKAQGSLGQY
jgi:ABC-2 type transport system permease protein